MDKKTDFSYWHWFFLGTPASSAGIKLYWNWWLLLHFLIACLLSITVTIDDKIATSLTIPFIGILIAITVAWCGNITALLNSYEITKLSTYHKNGIEQYAYSVQNSVLILLICVVFWMLVGLGIFNGCAGKLLVFFISSIAIRDCWNLILLAQYLTIARAKIMLREEEKKAKKSAP